MAEQVNLHSCPRNRETVSARLVEEPAALCLSLLGRERLHRYCSTVCLYRVYMWQKFQMPVHDHQLGQAN
jgi:hypothetical protein